MALHSLSAARLSGCNEVHHFVRDFAVGHVVLTNDLQSDAVNKRLAEYATPQRYFQARTAYKKMNRELRKKRNHTARQSTGSGGGGERRKRDASN